MKQVAAILQREKVYSLDFTTTNNRHGQSIRFWEGKNWLLWLLLIVVGMSLLYGVVFYCVHKC